MERKLFSGKSEKDRTAPGPMSFARQARGASTIKMDTPKEKVTHIIANSMIDVVNKQLKR